MLQDGVEEARDGMLDNPVLDLQPQVQKSHNHLLEPVLPDCRKLLFSRSSSKKPYTLDHPGH